MRTQTRLLAIAFTAASLVSTSILAAPASAAESVGNMKRIIVPEKGPPQTTIAPSGNSASTNGSAPASGVRNPVPNSVNVPSMIQGGLKKGGPLIAR